MFDLCVLHGFEISSLCNLCVLCVSVVSGLVNHRDTENTEVAQRRTFAELLSITSKPEADRGKLGVFVTEPGAIRSIVKIAIHLLEE